MNKLIQFIFIGLISATMAACSGGGGSSTPISGVTGGGTATSTIALTGTVSKGPVINANVDIYTFNGNGTQGAFVIGGITTDANGAWSANIPSTATGPFMMIATGGLFTDEYTGITVSLGALPIRGILPAGATSAAITPITDAVVSSMQQMVADGYASSPASALSVVITSYVNSIGFDPVSTIPPAPANLASATAKERQYAAVLGGISTLANDAYTQLSSGGNTPDRMEIIAQMADDFAADGSFDGYGRAAAPLTVTVGGTPQALNSVFTGGGNFAAAVGVYQALPTTPAEVSGATTSITPVDFTTTLYVADTTNPIVTAPSNINITVAAGTSFVAASDATISTFLGAATASDNIGVVGAITNNAPASFPVGTTTVIFLATDAAMNTGSSSATVTITVQSSTGGGSTGGGSGVVTRNASSFCPSNPVTTTPSLNGWAWAQPKTLGSNLNTVIEGNGIYLAAGDFGQILRSINKINWTPVDSGTTTTINKIIWDGSAFIIPGNPVAISCDGSHWIRKPLVTTLNGNPTTFTASTILLADKYYAFKGSAMYQSTDAVNWVGTTVTAITNLARFASFNLVANNGSTFVTKTFNPEATLVSTDAGTTWQTVASAPTGYRLLYWDGAHFVADLNFDIAISTDGMSWVTTAITGGIGFSTVWTPHMISYQGTHVRYGGNDFLQGSSYNNNGGLYIPDGTSTWAATRWHDTNGDRLHKINHAIVTSANSLLVVGDGGMIAEATSALPLIPILNPPIVTYPWTRHSNDLSTTPLRKITSNGSSFVAVGDAGNILYSTDGYTWVKASLPTYKPNLWLTIPIDKAFNEALWTGSEYLAIGNNTTLLTSLNGQTWTLNGVVQAGGVSSVPSIIDPANGTVVRSDNYIHTKNAAGVYRLGDNAGKFTKVDISGGSNIGATDFATNGTRFVAIGSYGISSTLTPSGVWVPVTLTNIPTINTYSFVGIAYSGTKFLAVANNTTASTQIVLESVDGLAWTQITNLTGAPNFAKALRGSTGKFVSLGDSPKESIDGGITWTNILPHLTLSAGWNNYDLWYDYFSTPTHEFLIGYRNTILVK